MTNSTTPAHEIQVQVTRADGTTSLGIIKMTDDLAVRLAEFRERMARGRELADRPELIDGLGLSPLDAELFKRAVHAYMRENSDDD